MNKRYKSFRHFLDIIKQILVIIAILIKIIRQFL